MKTFIALALTTCTGFGLFAQSPVQITGTANHQAVKTIKLFKVSEGEMIEIASSIPQGDKKFGFTFYPSYEGFYALGTGAMGSQTDNPVFYFKPGDQLELSLTDTGYALTGKKNSKENLVLAEWKKVVDPVYQKAFNWTRTQSTFVDFFPDLEQVSQQATVFAKTHKTGNKLFDSRLDSYVIWDLAANATNFLNTPRSAHPSVEEYADYYNGLSLAKFSSDAFEVYQMPWGNRTLGGVSSLARRINKLAYTPGIDGLQTDINLLKNDTLKGDAVLTYLARQKDYLAYKEAANKYKDYFLTTSQKAKATSIMNEMAQLKTGDQGLNFSFPDKNGKMVQFNDLKGKVVLIDVWATWCGPCKAEIPHLKKLEEEMQGTDVEVVSISVDEAKDKEKWVKMIQEESLGGLQLFAAGWGDFAAYYKITGIPRFMVFDRSGKVVSVDSPRPSNPALKTLLEKVLAEK